MTGSRHLKEAWRIDDVDRRLLWVITRSFVLKTCVFLLHGNYWGWGLDFHFVFASCWSLTWSLLGGLRCDCSTLEQDRHSATPSSDTFSHPACRFLSLLTNSHKNWRNNAQVHVWANFLLPWSLTNTGMGKKEHNCSKMLRVSPSFCKACILRKIVLLDSIVQKHCPSISPTLSLSYKYYFHKMQSELMPFFFNIYAFSVS